MNIFKLRPLALGCFGFLVCLAFSYFLGNIFDIILIVLGTISLVALIAFTAITKRESITRWLIRFLPLCLCFIICGAVALGSFVKDEKILDEYVDSEREVEALVTEINYSKVYETSAIAKVQSENYNFSIVITVPDGEIEVGDKIRATMKFRELERVAIGYSESEYYLDKGIFLFAEAEEYEILSRDNFVLTAFFTSINDFFVRIVEDTVNSDTASLISAMLLGNREALSDNVNCDFARLGISHVLALSGMHLSLITGMLNGLFSVTRVPKKARYILLILMIVAFICITGFSESAIRAGIMLIIFYSMLLIGQRSDGITALFVSVCVICILDPYAIFSTSLMLSFSAMLACMSTGYFTKRVRLLYRIRPKFIRGAVYTLITSVGTLLFTLPIVYLKFDYVSIFAPVFNVFLVPILTILLYVSPFILILGKIPYVSLVVKYPAELLTKLVLYLTGNISKLDFLTVSFTNIAHAVGALIILVSIVLALVLSKRRLKYCIAIMLTGVCVFVGGSTYSAILRESTVSVSSYDMGNADIVAIESKNEVMIIEMSSPSPSTASKSSAYASKIGYSDIDTYVIADYSSRMVDAFDKISDVTIIRKVMLPTPETDKERERYDAIEGLAQEKGIELAKIEESFDFGATCVDFMGYTRLGRSTKRCIAFSVSAYNSRFTYLGASAYEYPSYFPEAYATASDVVLLGSYGPKYRLNYDYELSSVDYFVFHGTSRDYLPLEIPNDMVKSDLHKFILK